MPIIYPYPPLPCPDLPRRTAYLEYSTVQYSLYPQLPFLLFKNSSRLFPNGGGPKQIDCAFCQLLLLYSTLLLLLLCVGLCRLDASTALTRLAVKILANSYRCCIFFIFHWPLLTTRKFTKNKKKKKKKRKSKKKQKKCGVSKTPPELVLLSM